MKVQTIALKDIEQNENSRAVYKENDLSELIKSMRTTGLLQPVGVRKLPGGKYDAVFGNRRIVAARKLGWREISAHVLSAKNETDRDLINMHENFKRQNTTLAEDGRMFRILMDRGLGVNEICAALDISKNRVEAALGVIADIPAKYRKLIVNSAGNGAKKNTKTIPASSAMQILNLRRTHGVSRSEMTNLLEFARRNPTTRVSQVAPLVGGGLTVKEAIKQVETLESIAIRVYLPSSTVTKIERKHKTSINDYIYQLLEANPELQAKRWLSCSATVPPAPAKAKTA